MKKLVLFSFILLTTISSCTQDEMAYFIDPDLHIAVAKDAEGNQWRALTSGADVELGTANGVISLLYEHPNPVAPQTSRKQVMIIRMFLSANDITGCEILGRSRLDYTMDSSTVRAAVIDHDFRIFTYHAIASMTSEVCITEIYNDGNGIAGTFEVHLYQQTSDVFPNGTVDWPDSLHLTEGTFRIPRIR